MRGASLIELLIALTLALVVSALAARVLVEAADALAWQPAAGELAARADALAQMLTADLAAAGAGPHVPVDPGVDAGGGPTAVPETLRLAAWLPPILPRVVALDGADPDDTAAGDRLSILTIADGAPQVALRRQPPRWGFVAGPTCPALVDGCRLRAGLPLLFLEAMPGFQLAEAEAVDAVGLAIPGVTSPADTAIVAGVEIVSYRFDATRGELVRARAGGRGLPVAGHIAAFAVELWGDGAPPAGPRWPPGEDTCLTLADGAPRLAAWAPAGAPHIRLDAARLADGPWCGVAPFRVDADLFRVRRVRVRLRLDADHGGVRGRDPARAGRPGRATTPAREVHDIDVAIDVAPPAMRGPS